MARKFDIGDDVKWNWGNGEGVGRVEAVHTSDVELTIKGTDVVRKASEAEPAYEIAQEDGDRVLKSQSELSAS